MLLAFLLLPVKMKIYGFTLRARRRKHVAELLLVYYVDPCILGHLPDQIWS